MPAPRILFFGYSEVGYECLDFFVEMKLYLAGEIVVEAAAREELLQPIHKLLVPRNTQSPNARVKHSLLPAHS